MEKIILASASPRRRELLSKAGVCFSVLPSTGEEIITSTRPADVVEELSRQKAFFVADKLQQEGTAKEDMLIIGADTIVAFQDRILGKPADEKDAVETLLSLQGNTHQVYTGVTVIKMEKGQRVPVTFSECTDVTFYPVAKEEILSYVRSKEPMDKAGSYGIQGSFGIYVKGICGDYNNVVGLPVARLFYEMKKLGIDMRG